MVDTRETIFEDAENGPFHRCRFKTWDVVVSAENLNDIIVISAPPEWIPKLKGWCILVGNRLIHESNFIDPKEHNKWIPKKNKLWSYWIRKNINPYK